VKCPSFLSCICSSWRMGKQPITKSGRAHFVKGTPFPKETDPDVVRRRSKQIEYGKSTAEYKEYAHAVPREERLAHHPKTPNLHRKYSRRAWDGLVRLWRCKLHVWDKPLDIGTPDNGHNDSFSSTSTSSSVLTGELVKTEDPLPQVKVQTERIETRTCPPSPRSSSPFPNALKEEPSWYEETLEFESDYQDCLRLHAEDDIDFKLNVEKDLTLCK